ncbi:MAG: hypothetical protein KBA42_11430 [Bacteroidales bacterium]|nr:hypothetical protein [Bacteroidales bacterium]MBP9030408.1 hypothetical protein [Bacteroidales bacterium]
MSGSGDNDSTLALYRCLVDLKYDIVGLIITINVSTNQISMHGVALEVLIHQAEAIGLPLHVIELPENCSMDYY